MNRPWYICAVFRLYGETGPPPAGRTRRLHEGAYHHGEDAPGLQGLPPWAAVSWSSSLLRRSRAARDPRPQRLCLLHRHLGPSTSATPTATSSSTAGSSPSASASASASASSLAPPHRDRVGDGDPDADADADAQPDAQPVPHRGPGHRRRWHGRIPARPAPRARRGGDPRQRREHRLPQKGRQEPLTGPVAGLAGLLFAFAPVRYARRTRRPQPLASSGAPVNRAAGETDSGDLRALRPSGPRRVHRARPDLRPERARLRRQPRRRGRRARRPERGTPGAAPGGLARRRARSRRPPSWRRAASRSTRPRSCCRSRCTPTAWSRCSATAGTSTCRSRCATTCATRSGCSTRRRPAAGSCA